MNRCDKVQGDYNNRELEYATESGNWFAVFGDIDDFIFYNSNSLTDEDEPRSMR